MEGKGDWIEADKGYHMQLQLAGSTIRVGSTEWNAKMDARVSLKGRREVERCKRQVAEDWEKMRRKKRF